MEKPKVQNLWNDFNESYSPNIFLAYTAVKCLRNTFCFELLERSRFFIEFGIRSHNLGAREERLPEP